MYNVIHPYEFLVQLSEAKHRQVSQSQRHRSFLVTTGVPGAMPGGLFWSTGGGCQIWGGARELPYFWEVFGMKWSETLGSVVKPKKIRKKKTKLIGDFNPIGKYWSKWILLPNFWGVNKKYLSCHHLLNVFVKHPPLIILFWSFSPSKMKQPVPNTQTPRTVRFSHKMSEGFAARVIRTWISSPMKLKSENLSNYPTSSNTGFAIITRNNPKQLEKPGTSPRHNTCQSLGLIFPCNKVLMVDPATWQWQLTVSIGNTPLKTQGRHWFFPNVQ